MQVFDTSSKWDVFDKEIIVGFKRKFEISREDSKSFKYLGLNINQKDDFVMFDQNNYVKSLTEIPISKERRTQKFSLLGTEETTKLRALIGQMSWVGCQTRPDLLFEISELAGVINKARVEHLILANKLLKRLKMNAAQLSIPRLPDLATQCNFIVYHDASYANLHDGGSQGSYIILLTDNNYKKFAPISWQSKRIKRVVKSTLAAETLSLVEAAEAAFWIQNLYNEITNNKGCSIECRTDSQSLYNAVKSSTPITDRRLRVDMAILREMLAKEEINKILWLPSANQIADPMTKKGGCTEKLLEVIMNNTI